MYYIVGLGNPGEQYGQTRHNVGWLVLDALIELKGLPAAYDSSQYSGRVSEGVLAGEDVVLQYPDTFMNKSGSAVKKLVPAGESARLIVVYDDVDLPLGELKVSFGKGAGGHNGIASIINKLDTKEFIRVRIGIARKSFWSGKPRRPTGGAAMTRHVLGRFSSKEQKQLEDIKKTAVTAIETIITDGVEVAMNRCN